MIGLPLCTRWHLQPAEGNPKVSSLFDGLYVNGHNPIRLRRGKGKGLFCLRCSKKGSGTPRRTLVSDGDATQRRFQQVVLWAMEGVYVGWLFVLPYAPGDPVSAIKPDTIKILLDLSLNFFYILPITNSVLTFMARAVGIHVMEAPASEGLFNFVIGWTLMFAPLLFGDRKKANFTGSLVTLWAIQMFLTNTLLIPYMAIRLGDVEETAEKIENKPSWLAQLMTEGAAIVGLVGLFVGVISIFWVLLGRGEGGFGSIADRWVFVLGYLDSDRPAYAFLWDICLYTIFQPWLIGDNIQNVEESRVKLVNSVRFVPYFGLVVYLLSLKKNVNHDI